MTKPLKLVPWQRGMSSFSIMKENQEWFSAEESTVTTRQEKDRLFFLCFLNTRPAKKTTIFEPVGSGTLKVGQDSWKFEQQFRYSTAEAPKTADNWTKQKSLLESETYKGKNGKHRNWVFLYSFLPEPGTSKSCRYVFQMIASWGVPLCHPLPSIESYIHNYTVFTVVEWESAQLCVGNLHPISFANSMPLHRMTPFDTFWYVLTHARSISKTTRHALRGTIAMATRVQNATWREMTRSDTKWHEIAQNKTKWHAQKSILAIQLHSTGKGLG